MLTCGSHLKELSYPQMIINYEYNNQTDENLNSNQNQRCTTIFKYNSMDILLILQKGSHWEIQRGESNLGFNDLSIISGQDSLTN
jgi:hypothetical protein